MRNCFVDSLKDLSTIQICVHLFSGWTTGHHYTCESLCAYVTEACVCVCVHVSGFVRDVCLLAARVTQLVHPCDSGRAGGTRGRTQVMSGAGVPWVNTLGYKWYLFTISVIKISDSI